MTKKPAATAGATTMIRVSTETAALARRLAWAFGSQDGKAAHQGEIVARALALLEAEARKQGLPLPGIPGEAAAKKRTR